ncbi:hypothetical protein PkP19E3_34760 (plasmid) [Pseudomonas koreensis]|nr:hypothetical protein PkP19E3_34760 [Pseudomonas koreensis]
MSFSLRGDCMSVFELVSPALVWTFVVVSILAALVHHISGKHQKITPTIVVAVALSLWSGSEPYGEPVPGALTFVVTVSTVLQALAAGVAYWVRDVKV